MLFKIYELKENVFSNFQWKCHTWMASLLHELLKYVFSSFPFATNFGYLYISKWDVKGFLPSWTSVRCDPLCVVVWWVMLSGYSLPEIYNVVRSIFDFICHIRILSYPGHLFIIRLIYWGIQLTSFTPTRSQSWNQSLFSREMPGKPGSTRLVKT